MMSRSAININPRYHKTEQEILSEQDWVEAAKKDSNQFEYLYNKYYESVFRFVFQRTNDEEKSHDLTSEVFMKALQNIHKYEFRGLPFSSWLLRIAQNEVYQLFRNQQKSRVVKLESDHLQNLMEDVEEDVFSEFKPKMLQALQTLKESEMQLIEMRFFEERPFKEIAEIFGKKESAIKMKLYRTLEKLKELIK